ncbi:MAG: LptF/LptG family permease [Magnetococcales bacterium]|nr:LptF/LptG family permease [Magnetococcales bacterium]
MSRLSRYLFTECALAFMAALLILTGLVLLAPAMKLFDFWAARGGEWLDMLWMVGLVTPRLLAVTLPMSLLVGILVALGRLSHDSELVVLHGSGLSLYQIGRPIALLVMLVTLASAVSNWLWAPQAHFLLMQLKREMSAEAVHLTLKAETFNRSIPGLTLYIRQQDDNGRMNGLLIHDKRNEQEPSTLMARSGRFYHNAQGNLSLFLEQGSRHSRKGDGTLRQIDFATYDMVLNTDGSPLTAPVKEAIDWSIEELQERMQQPSVAHEARSEWHRRWSVSIMTAIFGLLAIVVGSVVRGRGGRSNQMVIVGGLMVGYFLLTMGGELLVKRQLLDPLSGFWLPNMLLSLLVLHLARRMT